MPVGDHTTSLSFVDLPEFPAYRLWCEGTIQSRWTKGLRLSSVLGPRWLTLSHAIDRKGYHFINLRHEGKSHQRKIHRLVLEYFVGPPPFSWAECRHLDGDPHNNWW